MSSEPKPEIYFSFFMFTADLQPKNKDYTRVLIRHMQKLAAMGYDGFDLHIADRPAGVDHQEELDDYVGMKEAFGKANLTALKFATNIGTTRAYDPTSPDSSARALALDYLKSRVRITRALGGNGAIMSGPFLYPYGLFPDPPIWSAALQDWIKSRFENARGVFQELAGFAVDHGVTLALEPVKNWETPPPNMVSEALEFVKSLESKCGITIDTAQVLMESQGPDVFKDNVREAAERGLLNYVHISPPDRGKVKDSWIPWELMLGEFKKRSYNGPYLIEIFNAIPPFDALMRMSRRPFWWTDDNCEDPKGPPDLDAFKIAEEAISKLKEQLDLADSASGKGQPTSRETAAGKAPFGKKSSPGDSVDVSADDHTAAEFPFIVIADDYGTIPNAVRIHTFIASYTENNIANATHIIESSNALVIVDGQFRVPYARQFRKYADGLKKPIKRVYLSHRHPDHWFGIPAGFADQIVYAWQKTIDWINDNGELSLAKHVDSLIKKLGKDETEKLVPKTHHFTMTPIVKDTEIIDGVKYEFEEEFNAEVESQLTIKLPAFNVAIVQDLVYSGTHLYLSRSQSVPRTAPPGEASSAMVHWRKILQRLTTSGYQTFLPGHGRPAKKDELHANIEYLIAAERAFVGGMSQDELQKYLLVRYPERRCPGIFPIYLPRLYGEADEV